jgi:Protein of unknwon function (DUF3310)
MQTNDPINPAHYQNHPSGIECIEISKHLSGCLAQAFQYVWRCGQKDDPIQELKKALWFIEVETFLDNHQRLNKTDIAENIYKISKHEPDTNKMLALLSIASANTSQDERVDYLSTAVKSIQNMIEVIKTGDDNETQSTKPDAPQTTQHPL